MMELFGLSYALLCGIILLETLVLREAFRKTFWIQKFYMNHDPLKNENHGLASGTDSPAFSLPLLGTGKRLRSVDLKGQRTVLFFVSPDQSKSPSYGTLVAALHAWWHRMEGNVYVVCTADKESCSQFVKDRLNGFRTERTIHDEAGVLARGFRINSTPQAVELDQDARVKRYGSPESRDSRTQVEQVQGQRKDTATRSLEWPADRPMTGAAFARMDSAISCVLSRFRLNSAFSLIPFYLAFRRVRHEARNIEGLMKAVFLVEDFRTCYTLSFWENDWSIVEFGNVRAHISAANSAFPATYREDLKRAEIWSAQFRLWAVSCHNLNWEGLDFRTALAEQWSRREEVARMTGHEEEKTVG